MPDDPGKNSLPEAGAQTSASPPGQPPQNGARSATGTGGQPLDWVERHQSVAIGAAFVLVFVYVLPVLLVAIVAVLIVKKKKGARLELLRWPVYRSGA